MDINSLNSNTSSAYNQRPDAVKSKLGQQQFLQLLVAQMRNQDPINPLDGAEFASQLAQFNSVEQLISVNAGLNNLLNSQELMSASMTNSMAASLPGKEVRALSDKVFLESGQSPVVQYKLNNTATEVEIIVRNSAGNEVRREMLQGAASGDNSWEWDGRNDAGNRMADGEYTIEINASSDGTAVDSLIFIEGKADRVLYTGNGVFITLNNVNVPIGDIEEVGI